MVGRDPTTAGSPTRPLDVSYYRVKDYWTKDRLELGRVEDFPPHACAKQITPDHDPRR